MSSNRVDAGDGPYRKGEYEEKVTRQVGVNVGDPTNPLAADSVGLAISESVPAIRMILYNGNTPLGHISLTLPGFDDLFTNMLEAVEACKEQHAITDSRN